MLTVSCSQLLCKIQLLGLPGYEKTPNMESQAHRRCYRKEERETKNKQRNTERCQVGDPIDVRGTNSEELRLILISLDHKLR